MGKFAEEKAKFAEEKAKVSEDQDQVEVVVDPEEKEFIDKPEKKRSFSQGFLSPNDAPRHLDPGSDQSDLESSDEENEENEENESKDVDINKLKQLEEGNKDLMLMN